MIRTLVVLILLASNSASAELLTWSFPMNEQAIRNGPEADGSTNSPATGSGTVQLDLGTNMISYDLEWNGLVGNLTKLHIHGPASPSASTPQHVIEIFGPPALPDELATTSGRVTGSFNLTTLEQPGFDPISPDYIIDTLTSGQAYLNVHTTVFGVGEIRGNLGEPIPETQSLSTIAFGFMALAIYASRKRKSN